LAVFERSLTLFDFLFQSLGEAGLVRRLSEIGNLALV
jgi:hypothetical protein